MIAVLAVLGGVTVAALLVIAGLLVHVLRVESAAWRALLATVLASPVRLEHAHRVDDDTWAQARRLVKLSTVGREDPAPSRRVAGSPDPEAVASKKIHAQTIMATALRIQSLYREQGETPSIDDCVREAQQLYAGELAG